MGVNGNNPKSTKRARKFVPTTGKLGVADWMGANPDALLGAIEAISRTGGAIRFGYTRDGGAYAIGVYGDGEPYTVYVRPNEDLDQTLREMAEAFRE
jgi:hypothetical protein